MSLVTEKREIESSAVEMSKSSFESISKFIISEAALYSVLISIFLIQVGKLLQFYTIKNTQTIFTSQQTWNFPLRSPLNPLTKFDTIAEQDCFRQFCINGASRRLARRPNVFHFQRRKWNEQNGLKDLT